MKGEALAKVIGYIIGGIIGVGFVYLLGVGLSVVIFHFGGPKVSPWVCAVAWVLAIWFVRNIANHKRA
jgi:cation transporter-like permease